MHSPCSSFAVALAGEGGEGYPRGVGGGGGVGGGVMTVGWRRNEDDGYKGTSNAASRPVGKRGENSPEGAVVASARPMGKAAAMLN